MKIKFSKIIFLFVILIFIRFPFMSQSVLRILKLGVMLVSLGYSYKLRIIRVKDNKMLGIFLSIIVISSFLSYRMGTQFFYGLIYAILIYEMFIYARYWVVNYGVKNFEYAIMWLLCVLCFINDSCLLLDINFDTYILGSKFSVAYYHLLMVCFIAMALENEKRNTMFEYIKFTAIVCIAVYSIYICYMVDTNTGLIGIIVFVIVYLLPGWIKRILTNPVVSLAALGVLSATILFWDWILKIETVQTIIVSVLHRSLTLTGRLGIYRKLFDIFMQRPVIGWGYETEIVRENLYGNAQNGLVHLAIQYGVLGAFLFILLLYRTYKNIDFRYEKQVGIIISALYAFYVMATVEIVFSNIFFLALATLYAFGKEENIKRKKIHFNFK